MFRFAVRRQSDPGAARDRNIAHFNSVPSCGLCVLFEASLIWIAAANPEREHRPFKSRPSCVFHPSPTAPRLFPGTGAMDEAWKTRWVWCAFRRGQPDRDGTAGETSPVSMSNDIIRKPTPWRHETDLPWINGTTVDGVIHALSTATIPGQSSRGGQRVANPLDDPGRRRVPPSNRLRGLRGRRRLERGPRNGTSPQSNRG